MPDSVLRKKIVNEFLDPPASSKADPELLSKLILPDYVSGTYANEEVKARPEWEWTHTYQIKFFEREMQKAIQQGLFRGDPALAQGRFARLWDAFMKFEDAPGHVYYGTLTNVQNNRVSVRLSRYVLFGRPDFDDEKKMKKVAERANALARDGLRESLFTETLAQLEAARDSKTQASLLYQALQMALYVAAPNIWFSDPEFQVDSAGTTAKIKELLPKALEIPLALDSTREFVREVLTPRPDGSDTKAIYFVDDNGDFIYHLYLIQSYLRMNPKLRVAVVAKSERVAIDTTVSDLWYELEQPEFSFLKQITGSRLQVIEQGPVYGGVNLRNASRELVRAILDSDVVIGLGQMLTETMNGIQRPAYHQADVDSKFHQRATGLPKGALYFARVPAGKKYINHYAEDNRIVTLKQTFDMERSRSEMRSGKPIRAVVFDLGNVFVKIHAENAARRLIEAGVKGMTAEQVRKVLYNSSFYKRFEVNELSAEEFHAAIAGALGIGAMSFEIFKQIWCEIFELVPETVALASRVKKAGYKVFFLSDTNLLHMDYLRKQYGFFDLADRVFSSYELKFRKEDGPEVFKVMGREIQAAYGIGMDEMLFLDDKAVNVKASEEAGLPGHIFNSASAAEDELSKRGVAFPPIRSEVSAMPASREVGSRDWKNSTVILDSPPKNRVASKTDRRELTPKDPAEIPLLKEIVVFSIEAGDLAALKNWPELLAIASFNPRKLFVAVTGKADAKAEARIKELSHFVTVFRDEQLSSLPKNAPVFHFGNMTENADAVRVRISAKLGRDLKALLGIASGSFFLPALLLDEQVRDSALSSRGGFLFDDGRFTGRYLEALFRSFEVICASA